MKLNVKLKRMQTIVFLVISLSILIGVAQSR